MFTLMMLGAQTQSTLMEICFPNVDVLCEDEDYIVTTILLLLFFIPPTTELFPAVENVQIFVLPPL